MAGVKLHHLLNQYNHVLCHPEFLAPKYRCGHPKLLQLETPLPVTRDQVPWLSFLGLCIVQVHRDVRKK